MNRGWTAHNAMTPEQYAVNPHTVRKHYGYLNDEGVERAPKRQANG